MHVGEKALACRIDRQDADAAVQVLSFVCLQAQILDEKAPVFLQQRDQIFSGDQDDFAVLQSDDISFIERTARKDQIVSEYPVLFQTVVDDLPAVFREGSDDEPSFLYDADLEAFIEFMK